MMAMGWVTNLIQRGRASLDRLQIILETEPLVSDPPDGREDLEAPYQLDLEELRFHYPGRSDLENVAPALNGINLSVAPGDPSDPRSLPGPRTG